jgi:hypothetical protein
MSSQAAPSTSDHPSEYLRSRFQIGSAQSQRVNFAQTERVFHRNDIPQAAREARKLVEESLYGSSEANKPVWNPGSASGTNIRGLRGASWDQSRWDDKYYNALHSDFLVKTAQNRINMIREGRDPDADLLNIHEKRWDGSSKRDERVSEPQMRLSSTTYRPRDIYSSTASLLSRMERHKKQPENHISLVQREKIFLHQERARKTAEFQQREANYKAESQWNELYRTNHWNSVPEHSIPDLYSTLSAPNYSEIAQNIEKSYGAEVLQQFLAQQECKSAEKSPQNKNNQRTKSELPRSVHSQHHGLPIDQTIIKDSSQIHSFSTKFGPELQPKHSAPAWERCSQLDKQLARSLGAPQPYPIYRHTGEWLAQDGDKLWSCCGNNRADSRGCEVEKFAQNKARLVIGATDTRRKANGFEWSIHRPIIRENKANQDGNGAEIAENKQLSVSSSLKYVLSGSELPLTKSSTVDALSLTGVSTSYDAASKHLGASGPGIAIVKMLEHLGSYGRISNTNELAWSCCLNNDRDSQGCSSKTIVRENRWNINEL